MVSAALVGVEVLDLHEVLLVLWSQDVGVLVGALDDQLDSPAALVEVAFADVGVVDVGSLLMKLIQLLAAEGALVTRGFDLGVEDSEEPHRFLLLGATRRRVELFGLMEGLRGLLGESPLFLMVGTGEQ